MHRLVLACAASSALGCVYLPTPNPLALGPGDVTGLVTGVPPGQTGEPRPLSGVRVRLMQSALVKTTADDGRFTFRNLPAQEHRLELSWDATGDGNPDLSRVAAFTLKAHSQDRAWLDLGTLELLPP